MKICPNCKTKNVFDGAQFCRDCGGPLDEGSSSGENQRDIEKDDKLDFVVTEAADSSSPHLFGMEGGGARPHREEAPLEIKSTAALLDDDALISSGKIKEETDYGPIGESAPPPPPVADYELNESKSLSPEPQPAPAIEKSKIKVLSKDEIESINKNLHQFDKQNNKEPKPAALRDTAPIRPIDDPAQAGSIQKAHKVRGVAYFRNNFIQIVGHPFLHAGDEILINDKHYVLKPKTVSARVLIGIAAVIFAVFLVIIGIQFINPTVSGNGEIIGLILNQDRQPYLEGARVSIPVLKKTTTTNAQGFFRFELVPTGTYEIVYELRDDNIGRGNATVTAKQITLTTFDKLQLKAIEAPTRSGARIAENPIDEEQVSPVTTRPNSSDTRSKDQVGYGNIKLNANVADARIIIDDKILGAGNNTYARIKAGRHNVKVDKSGYSEYSTAIDLETDQTLNINATLTALKKTTPVDMAENFFSQGNSALAANNYQKAIEGYTEALKLSPNFKEAYSRRAEAYVRTGDNEKASADYIRLGEIQRLNNNGSMAISAFSSALTYSPNNLSAIVGRGGARLDNGDYRPALIDFEAALKLDNQFYPALFGGGICQFRLGNNKQADKYFKNAYKISQGDPYLYQYMMLNYLTLDDVKNIRKTYVEYKAVATPAELAEFKSSSRFAPVIRLIPEDNR
ncbi:MAG: tetratricopeptide repeat protein [candidate division Zixibacteria bacterium]|nr:tetratricopeptide repeat protein [candidate division Zixibacteria bacterium]